MKYHQFSAVRLLGQHWCVLTARTFAFRRCIFMLFLSLGLYLLVLLIRANVNIQKTTHGGGCKRACNGLVLLLGEAIDAKRREIPDVLVHPYSQPFDLSRKGRVEEQDWRVCTTLWILEDMRKENGATRVVPGSHRPGWGRGALHRGRHPDEVALSAQAGTVIVLNGHLLHAGGHNQTSGDRWILHGHFRKQGEKNPRDQGAFLTEETRVRLSKEARALLAGGRRRANGELGSP